MNPADENAGSLAGITGEESVNPYIDKDSHPCQSKNDTTPPWWYNDRCPVCNPAGAELIGGRGKCWRHGHFWDPRQAICGIVMVFHHIIDRDRRAS